ncbi:MAG: polymerase, sigma-24 subunit, subfamily [Bradyrhizobium sp.]|nr:polymerase, sigma-24 subunit, subfamily [Bradyrhizobium sp.]
MVSRADSHLRLVSDLSAEQRADGLESLYRRYSVTIRRHIEHTFGMGPPDPEDAVQAAFERFAGVEDKSDIKDPLSFLRRSARNFVLDHHRAAKVRSAHVRSEQESGEGSDDFDAERVLSARERLKIIDLAIRGMDERRREVLIMNRIHGLSCADIALRLGCSPTLVKMRLAEAVLMCRRALRAADGDV